MLRLARSCPAELVGLAGVRGQFRGLGRLEGGGAHFREFEGGPLEGDLRPELKAACTSGAPAELLELPLGRGQTLCCMLSLSLKVLL